MERNELGHFKKAPIKVGEHVVCTTGGFNPGFTQYKAYKVIATNRSCFKNKTLFDKLNGRRTITRDNEVIIIDNDGLSRIITLDEQVKSQLQHLWSRVPKGVK